MFERKRVPVPGIGRWTWRVWRKLRTVAEKRLNQPDADWPDARPARSHKTLPDSWDDYCIARQRCWKKQRRTRKQWDRSRTAKRF